jgi:hypothetical protein
VDASKFWSYTRAEGECVVYYGKHGRRQRASRQAWRHLHGAVPAGMQVLHTCDNVCCVRAEHLLLGTQSDNVADCVAKGRHVVVKLCGADSPNAKLTVEQVAYARSRYRRYSRRHSCRAIAEVLGVHQETVYAVVMGKTWR